MAIAGLLVHTLKENVEDIRTQISAMPEMTTYGVHEEQYIVTVAEIPSELMEDEVEKLRDIDGVLTVMLSDSLRHNTPKLFELAEVTDEIEHQQDVEPESDQGSGREIASAIDVANWFINQFDKESGDVITHLKVQKLLYFSEAWCQLLLDRELFSENMEAWAHGPVVREIFEAFKDSDWEPLNVGGELVDFDEDVTDVLEQVLETYGGMSAKTLEYMTCQAQPWKEVRGSVAPEARCTDIIRKESIKEYFKNKYGGQLNG